MSRGHYRSNTWSPDNRAYVGGPGSFFGHTPGDVENELDQLHGEIDQFGAEVTAWSNQLDERVRAEPDIKRLQADQQAAFDAANRPLGADPHNPMVHEKADSPARVAAVTKWHELQAKWDDAFAKRRAAFSTWDKMVWTPFYNGWRRFYDEKKHIALQTLPLSGTWDRIQDYRKKFVDTRNGAPFTPSGPTPTDPSDRKDPSFTAGLGQVLTVGKYALIGALALGGIVVLSGVASHVRKGSDPVQHYTELYRKGRKPRASRKP